MNKSIRSSGLLARKLGDIGGVGVRIPHRPPQSFSGPTAQPLILYGHNLFAANAEGKVNTESLRNPLGMPIEIMEIGFTLSSAGSVEGVNPVAGISTGGTIKCSFAVGEEKLTDDYIPVWNFGRLEKAGYEEGYNNVSSYVWTLDRPLYLPPGGVLQPSFQNTGITTGPIDVGVRYTCRVVKSKRASEDIWLPYVSSYRSQLYAPNTSAVETSDENNLWNPFNNKSIEIHRFIGRLGAASQFSNSNSGNASVTDTSQTAVNTSPADATGSLWKMNMYRSDGVPCIRFPTVFRQVFPAGTRAWECKHLCPPGAFYQVKLNISALQYGGGLNNPINGSWQSSISAVGYFKSPASAVGES